MTQKHFSTNSKITALVLSLLLIIGMIPLQVSAAEPTHDTILMEGINPTAEVKVAQFPNSSTQLMLLTCDSGETPTFARELYYSISRDGLSYQRPTQVKSDLTNDLYPFIYTPTGSSTQNDLIFTWTDADKVFDTDITPEVAANSMRISVAVMNSESLSFSVEPYTFSVHESNDVCHYKSRITNIDGKILVTWVVCSDIKQNDGCFSVVGMYYNPTTNTFSTDDNQKDENGDHVCAEKVIGTKMDYDELDDFLQKNNSGRLNKYISLLNIKKDGDGYISEWDDYCSEPNVIIGNEKDGYFYYIVSCNTPYCSIYYIQFNVKITALCFYRRRDFFVYNYVTFIDNYWLICYYYKDV